MKSMVGRIHLNKHTFGITFLFKKFLTVLYYLFFLIMTVYIFYVNKLI
jgi:hypothetical protein